MSRQAEINRLEDEIHHAESAKADAADLLLWSLRTLKQNSPARYAELLVTFATVAIPDADDLVSIWIRSSRTVDEKRDELRAAEEES